MNDSDDKVYQVRKQLLAMKQYSAVDGLDKIADILPRLTEEGLNEHIALFHNNAGRLPSFEGWDYGALLLECAAEQCLGTRRYRMYREALYRAGFAAANFEFGTRDSEHYQRLVKKMQAFLQGNQTGGPT